MISLVDTHITTQLQRVKRGGVSVTVYGPGASRPKDITDFPCYVVSHTMPPLPDMTLTRPYLNDYEASALQATVIYPKAFDENGDPVSITGPDSWTGRQWPIPHKLFYQIDLLATDQDEAYNLYLGLAEALPIPYTFRIGECAVTMLEDGNPANLNELERPLFRSAYRYKVKNVWTQRSSSWVVPGIKTYDPQLGLDE
jgi:hypothetical protein